MNSNPRFDVRRMLLRRGWEETELLLLHKGAVTVSCTRRDVFATGPISRRTPARTTTTFTSSVPAPVIVAAVEEWASMRHGEVLDYVIDCPPVVASSGEAE